MLGSARRTHRNGAVRLRSSIRCHCSSVVFVSRADVPAPALATRTSTVPRSASTRSNSSSTKPSVGDVARHDEGRSRTGGRRLLELGRVAGREGDGVAGLAERHRHGPTDAPPCARDERDGQHGGVGHVTDIAIRPLRPSTLRHMSSIADVYLIDAVRTVFGKNRGALSGIRTDDLAALPIQELVARHPPSTRPPSRASRSTTSTTATPTVRARRTATSPAWRPSSPGFPSPFRESRSTGSAPAAVRAVVQASPRRRHG